MPKTYRMLVIGAGGVGSWLSEGLVRMLEYRAPGSGLIIVDGDNYEEKNKERQNFDGAGNKAQVLAGQIAPRFRETFVIPLAQWVVESTELVDETEEDSDDVQATKIAASALLAEHDVVYAVVDNFKARKDICEAAKNFDNIDIFLGGNDDALYGSAYLYRRRDGQDVTDHPSIWHQELVDPPDRNPGEMSCAERAKIDGGTQFIAANFAVVAWLLGLTQSAILDQQDLEVSEIFWDMKVGLAQGFDRRLEKEIVTV